MSTTINGTTGVTFPDSTTQNTAATGFGFKNRIINGAMSVWQRGTSGFTTNGNYSADRWRIAADTSLSAVAQSTDVPSGFKYALSVAGTGYTNTIQRIEAANTFDLVGQSVTLSFWLKQTSGAGTNSIVVALDYANASDNFSGGTTQISSTNITATSSWAQYTVTFSSLPANTANGLQVRLYANTASATTYLITGVQLEKGSTATSFDYRPYGTELALCQRYCFVNQAQSVNGYFGTGLAATTTSGRPLIALPVVMRTSPSVTSSGNLRCYDGSVTNSVTGVTVSDDSNTAPVLNITTSGITVGRAILFGANNDATAKLILSAEL